MNLTVVPTEVGEEGLHVAVGFVGLEYGEENISHIMVFGQSQFPFSCKIHLQRQYTQTVIQKRYYTCLLADLFWPEVIINLSLAVLQGTH